MKYIGKILPYEEDPRDFLFKKYIKGYRLPPRPEEFGHEHLIKGEWGMLGNDKAGCCAVAGGAHEHMIWGAEGGIEIPFNKECVLKDYSDYAGYDPSRPETDVGINVRNFIKYRRDTGLLDANGDRHKIEAFVRLDIGDPEDLLNAMYLFGAVGIGVTITDDTERQFDEGVIWDKTRSKKNLGGHYVAAVCYRNVPHCVTWNKLQPFTIEWYEKHCLEAWAMLSPEMLKDGKTLENFNMEQLRIHLSLL